MSKINRRSLWSILAGAIGFGFARKAWAEEIEKPRLTKVTRKRGVPGMGILDVTMDEWYCSKHGNIGVAPLQITNTGQKPVIFCLYCLTEKLMESGVAFHQD